MSRCDCPEWPGMVGYVSWTRATFTDDTVKCHVLGVSDFVSIVVWVVRREEDLRMRRVRLRPLIRRNVTLWVRRNMCRRVTGMVIMNLRILIPRCRLVLFCRRVLTLLRLWWWRWVKV